MARVSLSTVVVAHDSLAELRRTLPPLLAQLQAEDELVVVDNASRDGLDGELEQLAPGCRLISLSANVGFAAGANAGAAAARGELLVFLNPDARVLPDWSEAIRAPWGSDLAAWMGLILLEDEQSINTSGGVLHFTGFGWAGQMGEPVASGPAQITDVGFLSGACLALPRARWEAAGGFAEDFFMYCEDVDLSLKLRLEGGRLAVVPQARVAHDYEFSKGLLKWRLLERNRWATILRTYPGRLLVLIAPALVAAELAVWLLAARNRWLGMKMLATLDIARSLPRLMAQRRAIQSRVTVTPAAFAALMTADLSSPYLGGLEGRPFAVRVLAVYWRAVRALL